MISVKALTHLELIEFGEGHKLDFDRMGISKGRQIIERQRVNQVSKIRLNINPAACRNTIQKRQTSQINILDLLVSHPSKCIYPILMLTI